MQRSPPPTPSAPLTPSDPNQPADDELPIEAVSTPEIQKWIGSIDSILNEVCTIVGEGKMNTEQKLRVSNLCRRVSTGTSQMAVLYQSLKSKTIQAHTTIQHLKSHQNFVDSLQQFKKNTSYASIMDLKKKADGTSLRND